MTYTARVQIDTNADTPYDTEPEYEREWRDSFWNYNEVRTTAARLLKLLGLGEQG